MIDPISAVIREIMAGDALSVSQAARLFPASKGDSPTANPTTTWRWIVIGTKSASGAVVKLEAARVGGRWLTSRAAIERFLAALTDTSPAPIPQTSRSESKRRKAIEAASKKLEAAGA